MFAKLAIGGGMGLFALLSAADWALTFALLRLEPGASEGNPVAAACLERYGWDGLALYKFGATAVVLGCVWLLARRRTAVAAGVLAFSCGALLAVTTYTHELIRETHSEHQRYKIAVEYPPREACPSEGILPAPERCPFPTAADVARSELPRASR
jgi:hypothetical protein